MPATDTESVFRLSDILRVVSENMETPVVVLLCICLAAAAFLLGRTIGEYFLERRRIKVSLPRLLEELSAGGTSAAECVARSGLLKKQKAILAELLAHPDFSEPVREALAVRLLEEQEIKYERIVRRSETIARIGPMLGLLGTLIPLGPGIIALGQGDTYKLSNSLLTAFDTTVAGLIAAGVATVVSGLRRSWYRDYMSMLEAAAECVLETEKKK
ncbi:MAG: MotA/TolQ/ExbB proton channel family protein [Oscillospiraceae bacterium]|jgi:biopolymer transport protein ExbB/TolQ|nr:MotA/TolQ/ExbB proton channel family protein [Oscillospiraceae bacterium]